MFFYCHFLITVLISFMGKTKIVVMVILIMVIPASVIDVIIPVNVACC